MKVFSKYHWVLLAGASACLPGIAVAQSSPGADTPRPSSESSQSDELQDIVVTAQRREQRGNDVGIAINVVTGDELASAGVRQVVDLASQTTNVQIKNVVGNSIPNVTIRGVGLNDYAANNNPAAGVYVDNVYLVSPAMLTFGLFDVDRVEVLKGPQGDLYGRNTTAGAINIISRRPTSTLEVDAQAGYGSYQSWHFNAAVGGPLTSNLNGRFAITTEQQGSGWQTNYVDGRKYGKLDRSSGRLQLEWTPVAELTVRLAAHAGYDRSDEALFKVDNGTTTEDDAYANRPRVSGASNDPRVDIKSFGASLSVDYDLSDSLTLTSITAYEHFKRRDIADLDGTSLEQLDLDITNKIEQGSQELRLAYDRENLNVIVGGYLSEDTVNNFEIYASGDLLPLLGLAGLNTIGNFYNQRTNAHAVFAHAEWTFAPRLTVIGGLRYTHERKLFENAGTFLGVDPSNTFDVFPPVSNRFSTSKWSGKLGLNFKAAEDTLIYASVSRGFKSGGFQGQLSFDPSVFVPFRDEKITAYELGLKSRVLRNLQLNLAAFNYDYNDAQFYGPLFDSPVGVLFGITNVGDARVRGVEGDIRWRPMAGLDLRAGAGFIDTEITQSIVPGVTTGSRLPNAPKLTLNGSVRYAADVSDSVKADITLSGNYQSRVAFDIVRAPVQAIEDGYVLVNGEIGVDIGERFRVSVFAKNLFDKLYRTQALFTSVGWSNQYGAPRTFGLNVGYKLP